MFKRREQRTISQRLIESVYPRGGWKRAMMYVQYRVRRLPDSPERIARGIGCGIMATFTPFYGMHFLVAFILGRIFNGNIFAGLASTFVGNPLTFPIIGWLSLKIGHWIMGTKFDKAAQHEFMHAFAYAWDDLRDNFWALFHGGAFDWKGFQLFYHEVFFPYLIGGLVPGVILAVASYFFTVPLIRAYQNRRRTMIRLKFEAIKARAHVVPVAATAPVTLGRPDDRGKERA
ncbi:DUF2062 domain-containing protein [Chachezhania sediminis]|uniref:DUF2062 domain-containing protein n=1 Tax=Chachezhania sediminis TaxID=2599291 RepID=UPI002D7EC4F8|nr:DUF2062 domain-containing protein [Chachezhania sediminis]